MTKPADNGRKTPWGRAVAEVGRTDPWRRPLSEARPRKDPWGRDRPPVPEPTVDDFRAVGLSESAAAKAAAGLKTGDYLSFEHAVFSVAKEPVSLHLDEMQARAEKFARPGVGE